MRDPEIEQWHSDHKAEHDFWEDADNRAEMSDEDEDDEDWECPNCGRQSCPGWCPL